MELKPNKNKKLEIEVVGKKYARLPIHTHVVSSEDDIFQVVEKYAKPHFKKGDMLFISERVVAITQGRAYPIKDIKPSRLAKFLVKFVYNSPYGIGLKSPFTMQLAFKEVGVLRILFGAFVAAVTKPFGIKGMFYRICGRAIAGIDGPCSYTLPPYNKYATLVPKNPKKIASKLAEKFDVGVVIIDANDLGVDIMGKSSRSITTAFAKKVFKDNPLGQTDEQTPLCVVRSL